MPLVGEQHLSRTNGLRFVAPPHPTALAQIDTPEKSQDFGQVSEQALSDLVYGKDVTIEVETIDKYGRTVGTVMVGGVDANLQQVAKGLAWVYTKYAYDPAYYEAEKSAKKAGIGLWSRPDAIPPWDYRHGNKSAGATSGGNGLLAKLKGWMTPGTAATGSATGASCGDKRYCKMDNCQEAMHYLNDCGLARLDRDGDGKPCESLCK